MDTISLYKNRIDGLMNILFGAGVSNPQTIIEQLNYLLFLRALSIKDDEAELLGITDESEKIFSGDLATYRWQNLLALNAEDLFKTLEESFDVLQKKSKNPTVKLLFRNAHVKIFDKPTLRRILHEIEVFAKELDAIAHEGNKDVFGDMYEYLLSKLSSAGTNGQFRTPRHIIDFMVRVVDPKKNETILDPACGTAGFLVAAYRYLATEYTSEKMKKAGSPRAMDKLSAEDKNFLFNHMFTGFDSDEDMIKFGMMNLHLHGLTKSRLLRQNSLTDTSGMKDKFDVILANPPFSGKIDEESVAEDIRMGTKATELLFLRFMMDHLSLKGKLAVIVPDGVIFNSSHAHIRIRKMLLEKGLWAIVSLPSGVFNPYAGVKTSLLFIDKEIANLKKEILFVKIENDGFDLGAQRRPIKNNDLIEAQEILNDWKSGKKSTSKLAVYLNKSKINENSDLNLSVDHYRVENNYSNSKFSMVELGKIAEFIDDGDWIESKDQATSGIRLIQTGNVGNGEFINKSGKERYISEETFKRLKCTEIFEGDVLLSRLPDPVGRACILPKLNIRTITAVDCTIFRFNSLDEAKYFMFLTLSDEYQSKIDSKLSGATRQRISKGNLLKIKIPLPPLDMQKKIVSELKKQEDLVKKKEGEIIALREDIKQKVSKIWTE